MMNLFLTWIVFGSPLAWSGSESFRDTVAQESTQIRQASPDVADRVDGMAPIKNRAGKFFFPGPDLVDVRAQVLIQNRLLFGDDEPTVRAALAMALDGEHRLPWSVVEAMSVGVRAAAINGYKQHGGQDAIEAFEGALVDASDRVRSEAMRLLGYRLDLRSEAIDEALRMGLIDTNATARRFTVRSIAWRGENWGFDAIVPLLSDGDPGVRGAAVRALTQLDRQRAKGMIAIERLSTDNDPRVKRPLRSLFSR